MPSTPYRLYLVHLSGCSTCESTKPEVEAWVKAHPWIRYVSFDFSEQEWKAEAWTPTLVPTLVLLEPNGRWHKREDGADQSDIEKWVKRACPAALKAPTGGMEGK